MNISRRWFLKSAAMVAIASQLPAIPMAEGHRVLFIDGDGALFVENYELTNGVIKAKVVNGAWDLVLDTHKKMMYGYSNPVYGYDAECTTAELKFFHPYTKLVEIQVSKDIGEVPEELKPRTVMVPKLIEVQKDKLVWEQDKDGVWHIKRDENGNRVWETVTTYVPAMKEVTRTWDNSERKYWVPESFDSPGYWEQGGVLTMTVWEPEMEEQIVDPLNGAGIDYNAVIGAARV